MRVLMFGWEFPPFKTGGLGTACHGLTNGLKHVGVEVTFVVPRSSGIETSQHLRVVGAGDVHTSKEEIEEIEEYTHIRLVEVDVHLSPYERPERRFEVQEVRYQSKRKTPVANAPSRNEELYGKSLFEEVGEYTTKAKVIAEREKFDVIHAHDWMTFQAGIEARKVSEKPLVVHVHSTEYDRTGGWGANPIIRDIEQTGMREADRVIAVSNRAKQTIMENYDIPAEKISVVYNAIDTDDSILNGLAERRHLKRKIVLFLGRITLQKGPDYFLEAASKVLEKEPDVIFVMAGSGDMMYRMIERASDLNIGHKVLFAGFLRGLQVDRMYDMADVYVMPSVSEPFGITPLEAMSHGIPVIISKQSGASEVIKHALKVDFWNVDKLADRIISVLRYKALRDMLSENGKSEVRSFSWDNSAIQCANLYNKVLERIPRKGESHPTESKVHTV